MYLGKMKQKLHMEMLHMVKNITVWSKLYTYQSTFTNKIIINDDDDGLDLKLFAPVN